MEQQEAIAVTNDAEQPSSEQTRVERIVSPFYERDGITIYNADCRDVLPTLGRFDLLLTDPPYGIGASRDVVRHGHAKMSWDDERPSDELLTEVTAAAERSIVWGGNYFSLPPSRKFLAWDKEQPEDFSLAMVEQACCSWDGNAKLFRKRVIGYYKWHPTQKPVELMAWCVKQAEDAQTILDPFMGSGTTLVAAKLLGLRAVGIEINREYCEAAVERLRQGVLDFEG